MTGAAATPSRPFGESDFRVCVLAFEARHYAQDDPNSCCNIAITQVILAEVPDFGIACERGSAEKSRNLFANVQLACRIGLLLLVFWLFVAGKSNEINGT